MTQRFIRSSYFGNWSLVLTTRYIGERQRTLSRLTGQAPSPSIIEIDLEPVNGWNRCGDSEIARMRRINVRRHCTARSERDTMADALPMATGLALAEHLGTDLAAWLLDPQTEILGLIDWRRFDVVNNGGSGLLDCIRPHLAHLVPSTGPSDMFGRLADALAYGLKAA